MGVMGFPESVGVARLLIRRAFGPLAGGTPALPGWPWGRCSWERGHLARIGPKARKAPRGATCLSRLLPRRRGGDGSDGVSRERGCRPLAHTAGLWPACGRDARAPRGRPRERCSWERGHLARIGPKARKVPRGATCPSRLLPRRRGGDGSDGVSRERGRRSLAHAAGLWPACGRDARAPRVALGAMGFPESVGVARLLIRRACGPLAGGTPALPGGGLGGDGVSRERGCRPLAHAAGLRPACGRDARAPRVALGVMFLGARASCPHRAEGPQSAERSDMPEPATPSPEGW